MALKNALNNLVRQRIRELKMETQDPLADLAKSNSQDAITELFGCEFSAIPNADAAMELLKGDPSLMPVYKSEENPVTTISKQKNAWEPNSDMQYLMDSNTFPSLGGMEDEAQALNLSFNGNTLESPSLNDNKNRSGGYNFSTSLNEQSTFVQLQEPTVQATNRIFIPYQNQTPAQTSFRTQYANIQPHPYAPVPMHPQIFSDSNVRGSSPYVSQADGQLSIQAPRHSRGATPTQGQIRCSPLLPAGVLQAQFIPHSGVHQSPQGLVATQYQVRYDTCYLNPTRTLRTPHGFINQQGIPSPVAGYRLVDPRTITPVWSTPGQVIASGNRLATVTAIQEQPVSLAQPSQKPAELDDDFYQQLSQAYLLY